MNEATRRPQRNSRIESGTTRGGFDTSRNVDTGVQRRDDNSIKRLFIGSCWPAVVSAGKRSKGSSRKGITAGGRRKRGGKGGVGGRLAGREIEKCGTRGAINLAAVVRLAHRTFRLSLYGRDLSLRPNSSANVRTAHAAI